MNTHVTCGLLRSPCLLVSLSPYLLVSCLCLCGSTRAAEISSNGTGGGAWSDPGTWRGKAAPTPADDVVIQKGDLIVFDRNDEGQTTCQKLFIDPRAALHFETTKGKRIFCLGDGIESYGAIKMDGTRSADDYLELRFVGAGPAKRGVKLLKGASLFAFGRANLPDKRHNVRLSCPRSGEKNDPMPGQVETIAGVMLDIQRADLDDFYIRAIDIDNTGSKPNERFNLVDNRLTGFARIFCQKCDTPVIVRNTVELQSDKPIGGDMRAIHVSECPLAEIRANTVRGPYLYGIAVSHGMDTAVTENTVEGCEKGMHLGFGSNHMLKQNTIRNCAIGLEMHYPGPSVVEETTIDGATKAVAFLHGTAQLTSLHITNLAKDGMAVQYSENGFLTLLNCNIGPDQVKMEALKPEPDKEQPARVVSMYYLVAALKNAPLDTEVEVTTVNPMPPLAPNATDLNIRNSPAPITKGITPLPQTLSSLVVKGWSIDLDGKPVAAPEYRVRILAPADKPNGERKVLGMKQVKPQESWFRVKPDEPTPTPEANFK